ncbi:MULTISPECIES: hypothetical protein [unclassified Nonomuraea]|uniref:hypothetical protein n=1 Tax=unclassified Nonomuraea TaxID=2593643 RepID=UPI003401D0F1
MKPAQTSLVGYRFIRTVGSNKIGPATTERKHSMVPVPSDRAEAIAELCDGAEAAIAAVRDMATGAALDDAALAAFMDENGKFL